MAKQAPRNVSSTCFRKTIFLAKNIYCIITFTTTCQENNFWLFNDKLVSTLEIGHCNVGQKKQLKIRGVIYVYYNFYMNVI